MFKSIMYYLVNNPYIENVIFLFPYKLLYFSHSSYKPLCYAWVTYRQNFSETHLLRPIYTVRLCSIRQAYDRPTT